MFLNGALVVEFDSSLLGADLAKVTAVFIEDVDSQTTVNPPLTELTIEGGQMPWRGY